MKRRTWWVLGLGAGGFAILAGIFFWSLGEARYRPGDVTAAVQRGLPLEPRGSLAEEGAGPGPEKWSLEVEPGVTVRGLVRGTGTPVVVIHGGPGFAPAATWAGLNVLGGRHRFYYPHQRGSGWSDRPVDRFATGDFGANLAVLDAKLGMVPQVADIERLRRALGVDKLDLVGHSFGGLMACLYAVEFPGHVGKILLIAPAALVKFPPPSGGLYEEIRRGLPAGRRAAYDAWLKDFFDYGRLFQRTEADLQALNAGVIPFYLEAAPHLDLPPDDSDPSLVGGWMMQALFFSLGQRHDWSAALAAIHTPVTLVYGDADLSGSDDFAAYRVISGLKVERLPGGSHFVAEDPGFSRSRAVQDALE